ncbi:putative adhesin [Pelagibaculum spongiae]|uniref:putative adhesin n=1 Tax=Pelagibaculum spongiae TaxID=2080658 RepID=UPI0034E1EDFA
MIHCHGGCEHDYFIVPQRMQIWFYGTEGSALLNRGILSSSLSNVEPYEIFETGTVMV